MQVHRCNPVKCLNVGSWIYLRDSDCLSYLWSGFSLCLLSTLFSSIYSPAPGGSCVCALLLLLHLFPHTCKPLLVFKQYQEMPPYPQPILKLNSSELSHCSRHYCSFVEEPHSAWQLVIIIDGSLIPRGTALQHVDDEVMV